jgi:hypothetical protein
MFADRETFDQAMEYAYMVAKGTDNPALVMTAVQVVVNTIAKDIERALNSSERLYFKEGGGKSELEQIVEGWCRV